ncbi:MAG TPA: hypothetical protein ENN07_02300, partial [candidate division Zixibacteria bacterium]|nr:hypothetical protein [candidate division Zixibacteria bacterium]
MGHVYTPGLKVTEYTKIKKRRILPIKGDVVVEMGDNVKPKDVVAKTELPGNVDSLNATNILGCDPDDLEMFLTVGLNEPAKKGKVIAQNKGLLGTGLFKTQIKMPFDGFVETVSNVTGNLILRANPLPVEVTAYIEGKIVEVIPEEGVVVETNGTFIQGIFGIGGERFGAIEIVTEDNTHDLTEDLVKEEHRGKILVCGRRITSAAFHKAIKVGVKGIIGGGVDDRDMKEILGVDIGVAITGSEDIETTLIVTEGFGDIPMAERTFELLRKYSGRSASMNGATQIRAGVIRPEIVIAQPEPPEGFTEPTEAKIGLDIGSVVRVIRVPYFGMLGEVIGLPPELR